MAVSSINEIIKYLNNNKMLLHEKFGVNRIGIFGSFAKKSQAISSDIDLVIEIEKGRKNIHSFMQLKRFLEKEMERKVDLGFEHTLKPVIKDKIKEEIIYV
jgi:predicted nucleotidyltransferase